MPATVLSTSSYPATLDPTLTTEFGAEKFIRGEPPGSDVVTYPSAGTTVNPSRRGKRGGGCAPKSSRMTPGSGSDLRKHLEAASGIEPLYRALQAPESGAEEWS